MSAKDEQVAGEHYKSLALQPIDYITANKFDFPTGNVIKYISRHRNKSGAEDVRKAIHYCKLILELEYGIKDDEAKNLKDLITNLYGWVSDLPVKHPQQDKWREEARKIADDVT
jgi:hypothetical protein